VAGVIGTTTLGTVTEAGLDFDGSVMDVAVMVTVRSLAGGLTGALYVTDVVDELVKVPAPAGEMAQVTPLFDGSLFVLALNSTVPPACTVAVVGVIETVNAGILIVAGFVFDGSATEVAVMVTVRSLAGGLAGALYVTVVLVAPLRVPAPDAGERVQVTPLFEVSY
jgi:hypothetical protein